MVLRDSYRRYGIVALGVRRLVPDVRPVVPPLAGALGRQPLGSAIAFALPSRLWCGAITYVAFTVGGESEALAARVGAHRRFRHRRSRPRP